MNAVERALRDFLAARPPDVAVAVVGGIAVSARTEPRFTRDLDFAVALADDDEAASYVFRLRQIGHLIAMKLVSRDDERRPQDRGDLAALAKVADPTEWARAEEAVRLIEERGFARKRDLKAALIDWRTHSI